MISIRRVISLIIAMIAIVALDTEVSAQELTRSNTRGNIRKINQGGLVPIDSVALKREQALAAARRDSIYYGILDSIGRSYR